MALQQQQQRLLLLVTTAARCKIRQRCCAGAYNNVSSNSYSSSASGSASSSSLVSSASSSTLGVALPSVPIQEHDCRPLNSDQVTELVRPHFELQTPVLLRHAVHHHRSTLERWKSWDYLEEAVGSDTACFAELMGGNYAMTPADDDATRCHIRFGDYISYLRFFEERYGRTTAAMTTTNTATTTTTTSACTPSSNELVYMAQNDLPHGLHQDVEIPSFCHELGYGRLYSTMIWIGPHGCVSPFHYDPLDNCYLQLVGRKRIWLYPPQAGRNFLYAGGGGGSDRYDDGGGGGDDDDNGKTLLQANTSPIDPRHVNLQQYPLVSQLPVAAIVAQLTPGDVLFLPKTWWHFVVTEETSVSVNQWWR